MKSQEAAGVGEVRKDGEGHRRGVNHAQERSESRAGPPIVATVKKPIIIITTPQHPVPMLPTQANQPNNGKEVCRTKDPTHERRGMVGALRVALRAQPAQRAREGFRARSQDRLARP